MTDRQRDKIGAYPILRRTDETLPGQRRNTGRGHGCRRVTHGHDVGHAVALGLGWPA